MKKIMIAFNAFALTLANSAGATQHSKKPLFLPGRSTRMETTLNAAAPQPGDSHKADMVAPSPGLTQLSTINLDSLKTMSDFENIASLSEGLVKSQAAKFFIDHRTEPAHIYFINGNYLDSNGKRPDYVQYHYYFAQRKLGLTLDNESFNQMTYFTNDLAKKKFIAGTLQRYEVTENGHKSEFLGIQFYPQDSIAEETLAYVLKVVKGAISIPDMPLKFVSYGSQQTASKIDPQLKALDIEPLSVNQIFAGISYVPMHTGTAYGFLRYQTEKSSVDDLSPMDIPIFSELPLALSVVSGVITTVVQDAGAHVNLKSKERNTPNMVLRDSSRLQELQAMDGKPVILTVREDGFDITPTTEQVVKDHFLNEMKTKKWFSIKTGSLTEMPLFDELAAQKTPQAVVQTVSSYGGKASKLALLAHSKFVGTGGLLQKKYSYRMSPIGLAVPASAYFDFLKFNPDLKAKLDQLVNAEMGLNGLTPPSPQERAQKVQDIQNMFYAAKIPTSIVDMVTAKIQDFKKQAAAVYPKSPVTKIKVRSSANAEDIPNFDGAGLHDSFGTNVDRIGDPNQVCHIEVSDDGVTTKQEIKPKTILCAMKGVYASLWNKRAIEERNFAHIDQRSAAMGLAINAAYDFREPTEGIQEVANAVLVTRVVNSSGVYGYRLSLNTEENLVTNPTPGTQSEVVVATFLDMKETPRYSYLQFAKTDPKGAPLDKPLLDAAIYDRMIDIARNVESSYCQNIPSYYPHGQCDWVVGDPDKPLSLDMEFKIFSNGEVLIKQVREFSGR